MTGTWCRTAPLWPDSAVEEAFPGTARAPGQARAFVRRTTRIWRLPDSVVDDAVLVISEAVANVTRHAGTPVVVGAAYDVASLLLRVADGHTGDPRVREVDDPSAEDGRGLMIIRALASEWGVEHTVVGKRLWARLPIAAAEGPRSADL